MLTVLFAALAIGFLPVDKPWSFLIVNALLLLVFIIDWLLAPKPSSVAIERDLPPLLTLDTAGVVSWTVRNPHRRRLFVGLADALPPSFRYEKRRVSMSVPGHGTATAQTPINPSRRGKFVISDLVLRVDGPLHLAARQGRRSQPNILKVYPPFRSRKEAELRIEKARILEVGSRSVRGHGGGTEFEQLREYSVDDDFRRMDWAATARIGKPIVRSYRAEQNQNVVLLLDCGRVMAGRVDDVPRLEHAMDAVMTMATVASRLGDRVGLVAFDDGVRSEVASAHGPSQPARITEAMYELDARLTESDYRGAFVHTLSRFRRRSLVVVLTELAEQGVSETLRPALPLILRNHLVVVASVRDPDVSTWARSVPTETNKAYRKAAAVGALDDRRLTVASLRHLGATVVDAVPGKLAASLADAYLQVKATGRL